MAALDGRSTDHVPVWLLFPFHATGYYVDVRQLPAYRPIHELAQEKCVTLNRRNPSGIPLYRADVVQSVQQAADGRKMHRLQWGSQALVWPDGRKMLDSDEDLELFCTVPIETDEAVLRPAMDRFAEKCRAERAEFPMQSGAMMLDLGEPVNLLYHSSNLESYAIWSLTHADRIVEFLERLMQRLRVLYRYTLENDLADVYFLVGSELAAPPLVGLDAFDRWIVPYARGLIELVRSYGKKTIQHFHGQIREVLPGFRKMGADAIHTIEAPPVGDCTFTQAYEALGNDVTLVGNIQYDDFRSMTEAQMRQAVRDVLSECKGRRLLLSPSAGPYDPAPSEQFLKNYHAFVDEAWQHGPWHVSP
jgi:hypothetical protein